MLGRLSGELNFDVANDEITQRDLQQILTTGVPIVGTEEKYRMPDGAYEFWLTTRQPILDDDGRIQYVLTVSFDITDRKRAEQELAEKEAQLRIALDNMPGGMMLGDRDLNYVLFNAQYGELYEFPDGLVRAGGSLRDELRYQADRGDFGPGDEDGLIEQVVATYQTRRSRKLRAGDRRQRTDASGLPGADARGRLRHHRHRHHRAQTGRGGAKRKRAAVPANTSRQPDRDRNLDR